jgi:NAD(P)H-dependent FMN reductase
MTTLVISSSLNPKSRSRLLALIAFKILKDENDTVDWLDLADYSIPFCDGDSSHKIPEVKNLKKKFKTAKAIIFAVPIYNYDVNSAAKNLIELTGDAWTNKVIGFLCAAGGRGSYMSVMSLANSLMLDFRCIIIPRFVYSTGEAFDGEQVVDPDLKERINDLVRELNRIHLALNK